MDYLKRTYRREHRQEDLVHFQIAVQETDLDIGIRKERFDASFIDWTKSIIERCRQPLVEYIRKDPEFMTSLVPREILADAPPIVRNMADAGRRAGVGPMAAVAGAVSEYVGKELEKRSRDVIVENGGDIYLRTSRIRYVGIFAGESPLSHKLAVEIKPSGGSLGICTSSGTVGHSLSFGKADAAMILSPSASLADAVATAMGNRIQTTDDLSDAVDFAAGIEGVIGAIAIKGEKLAVWGKVKLVPVR